MLLSVLEIKDFFILTDKAQRMKMTIHERNTVRDREGNKCGATGLFSVVGFKRPNDVNSFSHVPSRDLQIVGFHQDRSVHQVTSMASTSGSKKAKAHTCSTCR